MATAAASVPFYRHTQVGWALIAVIAGIVLFVGGITLAYSEVPRLALSIHALIVLAVLALFLTLTIEIDPTHLHWRFGVGLVRKRTALADIVEVEVVRNRWWWGLGIHLVPPGYWLYNVSGLDAVEIRLRNGSRLRLGSDEAQRLRDALHAAMTRQGAAAASS